MAAARLAYQSIPESTARDRQGAEGWGGNGPTGLRALRTGIAANVPEWLQRMQFGRKSGKLARQIEQLELRLEEIVLTKGNFRFEASS